MFSIHFEQTCFFQKNQLGSANEPQPTGLCPSPQPHQAQQFVLRPQPLLKTPSSYLQVGIFES
jgi:hypothetical protein